LLPTAFKKQPASITALGNAATVTWDEKETLGFYLRQAEGYSADGERFLSQRHLERAFVAFTRAGILIEKIPTHPAYQSIMSENEKQKLFLVRHGDFQPVDSFTQIYDAERTNYPRSHSEYQAYTD